MWKISGSYCVRCVLHSDIPDEHRYLFSAKHEALWLRHLNSFWPNLAVYNQHYIKGRLA